MMSLTALIGSGKSLLMKVLGLLLEGGDLQGQAAHDIFLSRLPASSPDRAEIQRFLRVCASRISTTAVGGNLHSMLADPNDSLALLTFKLFATRRAREKPEFLCLIHAQRIERAQQRV